MKESHPSEEADGGSEKSSATRHFQNYRIRGEIDPNLATLRYKIPTTCPDKSREGENAVRHTVEVRIDGCGVYDGQAQKAQ